MKSYLSKEYAYAFLENGEPHFLQNAKAWIVKRSIPETSHFDAMGCYPLFACSEWDHLRQDLEGLENALVSLSLVTDPFGDFSENLLANTFNAKAVPFKDHYIADLSKCVQEIASTHHRRYARKALKAVGVEIPDNSEKSGKEFSSLYTHLIKRHNIRGLSAFSLTSLEKQAQVPGSIVFAAKKDGEILGMVIFYVQDQVAYYHLGAYSDLGYDLHASFAIFWIAIDYFASSGIQWLSLGAGAGLKGDAQDGLSQFKKGWATGTRTAYFCGHVFNRKIYEKLASTKMSTTPDYFPSYRVGEFQ